MVGEARVLREREGTERTKPARAGKTFLSTKRLEQILSHPFLEL